MPQATRARNVLSFLSYRASRGLMALRHLLRPRHAHVANAARAGVAKSTAIERGIGSVLERLAPNGEVAHEEDIGEFAILRNAKRAGVGDRPIYDYGMVDDDFMLAPLAALVVEQVNDASTCASLSC